ncbi:LytR/AlgR family response regulator transcription factor [Sporomusa sphaeroides]|uniref:Transcriptional regulatory protein YpdB n=1 Tax=Sporomusa sphaeroides DSM 2875 TaxID=1337886 RepID=A0ABM9W415_9FIRM|nr:LytTR family DNA-binding domain-containing protein [Sporomusa sphaeroides]OLS56712.1 transcriptional regulatory protein YpdB [Sporomusa sphaeroides DSM 2875]CVK18659.1 Transcriptional regulatory protein YpdB [Sporomusa sphaeroides DSM 2875]
MTRMKGVKVVIADDEKLMAQELRALLLELYSDLQIVGVVHDGETALQLVKTHKPDIAFLDIQMPGMTGLAVAKRLIAAEEPPAVVFATAYDEYALKAFSVNAMDYILKPYDEADIRRVMEKFEKMLAGTSVKPKESDNKDLSKPGGIRKFSLEKGDRMEIIDSDKIELIYAKDRLVYIKTLDGEIYRTKLTLQEYEGKLPAECFFRCHRNYIVNVNQIKEIATWFNKGYILILKKNAAGKSQEVPVGRAYAARLREYIEL